MTATILQFPLRKPDANRLALVGAMLSSATPVPSRDAELDMLIQIGGKLLDNLEGQALDRWLARLDAWDASRV